MHSSVLIRCLCYFFRKVFKSPLFGLKNLCFYVSDCLPKIFVWRPILTQSLWFFFINTHSSDFMAYNLSWQLCYKLNKSKAFVSSFLYQTRIVYFWILFWQRRFQKWPGLWRRKSVCCVGWWQIHQTTRAKLATWKQPGVSGATSCCLWVPLLTINFPPSPWKFPRAATTYGPKRKRPLNTFTKTITTMPTGSWRQMMIHMLL